MAKVANDQPQIDRNALAGILKSAHGDAELFQMIVNAPFSFRKGTVKMSLGILVFLQVNKHKGTIDRIALSDNELAKGTTDMSVKKFEDIRIPIDDKKNSIAIAIRSDEPQTVADWEYLFTPALTPTQARFNQAAGAIGCSVVYPLNGVRDGGAMIFSFFKYPGEITKQDHAFMRAYCALVTGCLQ